MKIIIAGSRTFKNYLFLKEKLDIIFVNTKKEEIKIVSGTADGADKLGEKYAKENNIEIIQMPADWDKFGKKAGYIRNEEMAKIADACVVFWDGNSKGSKHMIDLANKYKLKLRVIKY